MPHIHTQSGQHDHTASAIIIRLDGGEPKVMLHRHKNAGVYIQFGGHVELDETPWQAIAHELLEESGYDLDQLTLLQPHDRIKFLNHSTVHPQPVVVNTHQISTEHAHIDSIYAFVTSEEPAHNVAEGESSDFCLLNRQELVDLPEKEMFPNVREICLHIFDVCLPKWERVNPKDYK